MDSGSRVAAPAKKSSGTAVIGPAEAQQLRVGEVVLGHLARQLLARDAGSGRRGVDLVVDVGDVGDQCDRVPLVHQEALEQREHDERACVPDVDAAVDGRSACIDPEVSGVSRHQRHDFAAERVVEDDLAQGSPTVASAVTPISSGTA